MAQKVQSVIFSKTKGSWTVDKAKRWLKSHNFKSSKVDETSQSWRFRQFDPQQCKAGSFITLTENFPNGVSAVSCDAGEKEMAVSNYKCGGCQVEGVAGDVVHLPDCPSLDREQRMQQETLDFESEIKDIDSKSRRVTHVISTASMDRYNDVIDVEGWNLRNFRKNPVVLKDHRYTVDNIIGKAVNIEKRGDGLYATTKFHDSEVGREAMSLVESGVAKAWSVGFRSIDAHHVRDGVKQKCDVCKKMREKILRGRDPEDVWVHGRHYTKAELLEYSLVAIPANQDVVMNAIQKGFVTEARAMKWFKPLDEMRSGTASDSEMLQTLIETLQELSSTNKKLYIYLQKQEDDPAPEDPEAEAPPDEGAAEPNAVETEESDVEGQAEPDDSGPTSNLAASLQKLALGMRRKRAVRPGDC